MKCSYCNSEIMKTKGVMLVRNDGSRIYFCSGKCEKNWEKGRNLKYRVKRLE